MLPVALLSGGMVRPELVLSIHTAGRSSGQKSGNAGANGMSEFTIGSWRGGLFYWDGDIAEVIIYDSNLSDADKNEVGGYLATKYGLSWTAIE